MYHAAPVVFHLLKHTVVLLHDAEGFEFVEPHIGCGDWLNVWVEHDTMQNLFFPLCIGEAVDDGEHIGEFRDEL